MVRLVLTLLLAAAPLGCSGRSIKVDNPVVGPPPPRMNRNTAVAQLDSPGGLDTRGQSDVVQTVATGSESGPLPMTAVAARVNGKPILVGTVLAQARGKLRVIEKQAPPDKYRQIQMEALKELLPMHIEQALMVQAVRSKMKDEEQFKAVEKQLDEAFEQYLHGDVMKKMKVNNLAEVEATLQQQGLTLQVMRDMWVERTLAQEYMRARMETPPQVTAPELRTAYHERVAEFTEPEQVKWQQIQISYSKFPDKAAARAKAQEAQDSLNRGESFDEVARKYSDGADAANGGHWDWTRIDSLADDLRVPLSNLSPNTPSELIATPRNLQIVQIEERRQSRVRPFEEVQADIKKQILEERHKVKFTEILSGLRESAVIETIFDDPTADSATPAGIETLEPEFSAFSQEGS